MCDCHSEPLFDDLNADGNSDALGVSGHMQAGKVYINDGAGTLHKLYTQGVVPEFTSTNPDYQGGFGWTLRSLDKSRTTTLQSWGAGFATLPSWAGSSYSVPEVSLVRRAMPLDAPPVHPPEDMQRELQRCLTAQTWIDQCAVK